jgi:hypothetical protein
MMNKLWTDLGLTGNKLWMSSPKHDDILWTLCLIKLNSLCTSYRAWSNNFVQLKHQEIFSAQSPVEQRVEQPVANHPQQPLNKPSQVVHGTRTVFEQLFENLYLFKTTNVSSSALTPSCTSPKPLKHNRFSTLSTIY